MIKIKDLKKEDVGKWVEYTGGAGEKEKGKIKSWNNKFIFVVYKCNNEWDRFQSFTGQATLPKDINYI